ncbi:hypothetical protein LIER_37719 [Lithospermum erythrorhizon]|uniref:Uncharacterized protein n=1 Tax=Lithospermum erythrorhizon TaxID=34254 RepID=A0AAV3PPN4_LITER
MPGVDKEIAFHKLHVDPSFKPGTPIPRMDSERGHGQEVEQQVENVRKFHEFEYGLPKGLLSFTMFGKVGRRKRHP